MADDLLLDQVGSAVIGFGSAFLAFQPVGSAFLEEPAELEVALPAEAELVGGEGGAQAFTVAFVEHGEFADNLVIGRNGQGAARTFEEPLGSCQR